MRRTLTIALAVALVAAPTAGPAGAAKKKSKRPSVRTFEVRYEQPAVGVGGVAGGCTGCPAIAVATDETYAVIVVEDDNSPNGYVELQYDANGDGIQDPGSGPTVCGSTAEPAAIEPGQTYTAWPWTVGAGCPGGASTSGTIKVLLSNSPAALEAAVGG